MATTVRPLIPSELQPELKPIVVKDEAGLCLVEDFLKRTDTFCIDSEWPVTEDFTTQKLRLIQIGDRNEQYLIDLLGFAGSAEALSASQGNYGIAADLLLGPVIKAIGPALESSSFTKVGVNLESDYKAFRWCLGIRMTGMYDCYLAEKNILAGLVHFMAKRTWAFEDLLRKYVGLELSDTETGKSFDLISPLTDTQISYTALDVRLPLAVRNGQLRELRTYELDAAVKIDCDAISPFGDMYLSGIGISHSAWQALIDANAAKKARIISRMDELFIPVIGTKFISKEDTARLDALEAAWRDSPQKTAEDKQQRKDLRLAFFGFRSKINAKTKNMADCEGNASINYRSNQQLTAALRKMGFGMKKLPNTLDKTLEKLAEYPSLTVEKAFSENGGKLEYPVIDLLRLYRTLGKLIDNYGRSWISYKAEGGHLNSYTGRIHSYINLLGAATGRTSSSSPNIQNIPKESAYRNAFVARPGYKILTVDYSGAELRILAYMSQEPVWLEAFQKNWDVHSVGAEMLYGDLWKNAAVNECFVNAKGKIVPKCAYYYSDHQKCDCPEHKTLRGHIKSVNFGLAYGLQAKGLADQLGISVDAAEELLRKYKAAFPTVMKFLDQLGESSKTFLVARTVTKRWRRWIKPTWELAKQKLLNDRKLQGKPITTDMVRRRYVGMSNSIEREGKNMPIQGTNGDFTKRAMFLIWKKLSTDFNAYFINMVHDELVIECPEDRSDACFKFVGECMEAAGAEWISGIRMTVEGSIENFWAK